eukprot:3387760-Pleurochrysis_carterae.AAC.2
MRRRCGQDSRSIGGGGDEVRACGRKALGAFCGGTRRGRLSVLCAIAWAGADCAVAPKGLRGSR